MNSANSETNYDMESTNSNKLTNDDQKTKKMDYLKHDEAIPGQKYALISMVEPKHSKLLMNRESFIAANFIKYFIEEHVRVKQYEYNNKFRNKKWAKLSNNDEKSTKNNEDLDTFMKEKLNLSFENIRKLYYEYQQYHGTKLDQQFNEKYNPDDEIVITGFKIRGVYPNETIARAEVDKFHLFEPAVDIYVAPVGKWIPYCSNTDQGIVKTYGEEKLNNIMAQKDIELQIKKAKFDDRMQSVPKLINGNDDDTNNDEKKSKGCIL